MRNAVWLSFVCGLWIALVTMSGIAATRSLRTVDEILAQPPAGSPKLERAALRFHAAELNRDLFRLSEYLQIALASAALWLARRERFALWATMLCAAILLGQRFVVTPEITALGRQLDFATTPLSLELAFMKSRNGMFHGISVSPEMLKLCGVTVVSCLAIRGANGDRLPR